MVNRVLLVGRLTADPEMKQTQGGVPCTHIRIAINRKKKQDGTQEADFINCTAWRQTAEFICRYFAKGNMIIIDGQLRNNDYTDNNGVKHYSMDVLVDSASFAEPKNAGADQSQQPYGQQPPQQYQQPYAPPPPQQPYQQPY